MLQRTLKIERCDLNHMTVEVNRLKSKRKNGQIKSLKEKLAAACDLHMVVSQQVEERSKELEEERKHRMHLSKVCIILKCLREGSEKDFKVSKSY